MALFFILSLLLLSVAINSFAYEAEREIDRFQVIWNTPSLTCIKRYNITIPLARYGIKFNRDEAFSGDEVTVFYSTQLGLYPYISTENHARIINGGIPQKVNMGQHFAKMRLDIRKKLPKKNFAGIAVIDWEDWRPLWESNFGKKTVYRKLSIEFVKKRYPLIPAKRVRDRARHEFNKAARKLMLQTIRYAKKLRPLAKWGFYGFPYCHCDLIGKGRCNEQSLHENDRMHWLFDSSVALYPTIYLYRSQMSWLQYDRHQYVQAVMEETLRMTKDAKRPYFAFTKFTFDPYAEDMLFYREMDLCTTLQQTADLGGSGVVIWSSTSSTSSASKCKQIAEYMKNLFGPTSHRVIQGAQKCSNDRCSGHGACVRTPLPFCNFTSAVDQFNCLCDLGFHGSRCDNIDLYNNNIEKLTSV